MNILVQTKYVVSEELLGTSANDEMQGYTDLVDISKS